MTISLPNLSIYGKGDVNKEYYRSNVFDDESGIFTNNLAFSSYQDEVRTRIKDPFSVAFGLK